MPTERDIGPIKDAKEFSIDIIDTADSGEMQVPTKCTGGKCLGPCVQRCLPPPPQPRCR